MSDTDAGNVKAKASIEYDPSGMKQFKEDLASLPSMVGGLGQSAGQAGSELEKLGKGMSANAESARSFTSALSELPELTKSGTSAVSEMSGVLSEQRSAIEEAASAHETLQKSVESTVSSLEKAPSSIQVASEHTQKLAESVQSASQVYGPMTENMSVFHDALATPEPYQMVMGYLNETGQTWGQFAGSIGESNLNILRSNDAFRSDVRQMGDVFPIYSSNAESYSNFVRDMGGSVEQSAKQFSGFNDIVSQTNKGVAELGGGGEQAITKFNDAINQFGGVGHTDYGPKLPPMLGPELPPGGVGKVAGIGDIFGGASEGMLGMLNDIAMPLMALQMVGMAVQSVGQAMYDSAAIAEGPAAHSMGTFTGTVDALGQSAQKVGAQFSESFGQQLLPVLNATNYQLSQTNGGGAGGFLGGLTATVANLWQIGSGVNVVGGTEGLINQIAAGMGLQQPFQGPGPEQQAQIKYQQQLAQIPQTVQQNAQQLHLQADTVYAQANSPEYLAAQQQAQFAQTYYQHQMIDYNVRNPVNPGQMIANMQYDTYAAEQNKAYQQAVANSPSYLQSMFGNIGAGNWGAAGADFMGGIGARTGQWQQTQGDSTNSLGDFFKAWGNNFWSGGEAPYHSDTKPGSAPGGIFSGFSDWFNGAFGEGGSGGSVGAWFNSLFSGGGGTAVPATTSMGGCFVAGTPVLLADGSEKAIETLRVDERVLAYDGQRQVAATIVACISFPAKQTYELVFSDGKTLTTTDSHPLASVNGWKSISPKSTHLENPDLPVTALQVGDNICTADGTFCRLVSIQKRAITQVFNVTVDGSHTYYASRVLVHNAKLGNTIGSGSLANDGTGSQQVQVSHTFVANVQWEANNLQKQFTGAASWVGQNLANTFQGAASWVAQGLSNTFQGAATWVAQGLSNTFNGIANWVGQNLANTFNGVADWVGQNLSNTFNGVASWAGTGLSNTFKGVASWAAQGLEHTFNAVANWTAQNLTPNFTVNPSFTMLAEGTSNWGGGPAIVGEAGPEVVESNGHYSMFDAGASLVNLPVGANVYPMKDLAGSSVAQFANGTGNILPLNIGVKNQGGNMPESINVYLQIDGQTFWSATGMSLAQSVYAGSGDRSY